MSEHQSISRTKEAKKANSELVSNETGEASEKYTKEEFYRLYDE